MRPLLFITSCAAAGLLAGGLRAQEPQEGPQVPLIERSPVPARPMSGEIMEIRPDRLVLRPWNSAMPRRVEVLPTPETRWFWQERGGYEELRAGDLVLVVPPRSFGKRSEEASPPAPKGTAPPPIGATTERHAESVKSTIVLRYWPLGDRRPREEERRDARTLLQAAGPYFKGTSRGSVIRPRDDADVLIGRVLTPEPLVIRSGKRTLAVERGRGAMLIANRPSAMSEMKRGETLFITCTEGPAAEQVRPLLACRAPKSELRGKALRRFLLREKGQER